MPQSALQYFSMNTRRLACSYKLLLCRLQPAASGRQVCSHTHVNSEEERVAGPNRKATRCSNQSPNNMTTAPALRPPADCFAPCLSRQSEHWHSRTNSNVPSPMPPRHTPPPWERKTCRNTAGLPDSRSGHDSRGKTRDTVAAGNWDTSQTRPLGSHCPRHSHRHGRMDTKCPCFITTGSHNTSFVTAY